MKDYVKPEFFYEDFHLSHSVANCGMPLNHATDTCSYNIGAVTIFTAGVSCEGDTSMYSEYCDFNGATGGNFLTS